MSKKKTKQAAFPRKMYIERLTGGGLDMVETPRQTAEMEKVIPLAVYEYVGMATVTNRTTVELPKPAKANKKKARK